MSPAAATNRRLGGTGSLAHALGRAAVLVLATATAAAGQIVDWDFGTLPMDGGSSKTGVLRLVNNCKVDRTVSISWYPALTLGGWNAGSLDSLEKDDPGPPESGPIGGGGFEVRYRVPALSAVSVPIQISADPDPGADSKRDEARKTHSEKAPGGSVVVAMVMAWHIGSPPACLEKVTDYRLTGTFP